MNRIYSEFEIRDDMDNDAYEYYRRSAIEEVTQRYKDKFMPDIFDKNIAYKLHIERYKKDYMVIERIVLEPIPVQIINYEPTPEPYLLPKKYSLKDRIKILFTGRSDK